MLNCDLRVENAPGTDRPRVCAVSYLNTIPLVWGILHGPQQNIFNMDFALPAECADRLGRGEADIGIVPCAELPRLDLEIIRGTGIACTGPVRSILLISRVPFDQIRTVATDSSSRTSVMLTRIILARKYRVEPALISLPPDVPSMLERADAALIIGDPALLIDPATVPFHVADLGQEWVEMTGLPMVFAVWAGRKQVVNEAVTNAFLESYRFGRDHMEDIVSHEAAKRGITEELARDYLTHHIHFELGPREYEGMELFLRYAAEIGEVSRLGAMKGV